MPYGVFNGVAAITTADVWAVGESGFDTPPLLEHWDGKSWRIDADQGLAHAFLQGSAFSAGNLWAVGTGSGPSADLRTEGNWTPTMVPAEVAGLNGVAAFPDGSAWAVGYGGQQLAYTVTEHWDGNAWSNVASVNPDPLYDVFLGIAGTSPSDIWAVGTYGSTPQFTQFTLIEHWDGTSWKLVPSP